MIEQTCSEFEAWFESLNNCKPAKQITPSGWYYWDQGVDDAWQAWQASRAALCVELPADRSLSASDDPWYVKGIIAEAIHAAGVKTK